VQRWLDAKEIKAVVDWSHNLLAHSADQVSNQDVDFASITPTMDNVASAQRHIARATEAISAFLLRGPAHGNIVPVVQLNQFYGGLNGRLVRRPMSTFLLSRPGIVPLRAGRRDAAPKARFASDSPLEGRVRSEPVSEIGLFRGDSGR
jgi:hypothetical protein